MKILIIRHAEPDYPHNMLTEKGFREAEMLSDRLEKCGLTALYSSPLPRAVQTAEPTAGRCHREIQILDWLQEFRGAVLDESGNRRVSWNLLPRSWSLDRKLYSIDTWLSNPMMSSVNVRAEYENVTARLDELLSEYGYRRDGVIYRCVENRRDTIALFCHFGVGMVLVSHLTGISPVLLWQSMFLPTSSVSTFVTEERIEGEVVFKCMQLGDTSHLYANGESVSRSGLFGEFYGGAGAGPQV